MLSPRLAIIGLVLLLGRGVAGELEELAAKADKGDAAAAYLLYDRYAYALHDEVMADRWQRRAAILKHPLAQRELAERIVIFRASHAGFGETAQAAVLDLLTQSSKVNGAAAHDLGKAYQRGYFGVDEKDVKARAAFQQAVSLHDSMAWSDLAGMLHRGEGGPADQNEAYYFICLDCGCNHPDPGNGKEIWNLRKSIEIQLSLAQEQKVWDRVDAYLNRERRRIGSEIHPPPFGGSAITEEEWKQYLTRAIEAELKHRKQLLAAARRK